MVARTVSVRVIGDSSSAKKALDETGDSSEHNSGRIGGAFKHMLGQLNSTGVLGPFGEALAKATEAVDQLGEHGKKIGAGLMVAGGAAMGAGMMFQQIGSKDRESLQQLKATVEATGKSYEDYAANIEWTIKAEEKHGHQAHQTQDALRILTQATNDPEVALKYLATASDLAAAKHIGLAEAATMLGKAYNGSTKILKEFHLEAGPKLVAASKAAEAASKGAEAADTAEAKAKENLVLLHERLAAKKKLSVGDDQALLKANEAVAVAVEKSKAAHEKLAAAQDTVSKAGNTAGDTLDKISGKLHGQADAAADSFAGHLRALKAEIEDGAAKIGQKYGPALTGIGAGMSVLGGLWETGAGLIKKFSAGTEVATGAEEGLTAAKATSIPITWAALGPILLIVAAIAVLAFGIYELATHWKTVWNWIKQATSDAIGFITGLIGGIVDWIKGHWQLLLAILTGPFGLMVLFVKDHFHEILRFIEAIPGDLVRIGEKLLEVLTWPYRKMYEFAVGHFDDVVHFIEGIPSKIAHVGEALGKALANGWIWGLNNVIAGWDWLVGMLKIPGFDLGPVHFGGIDLGSSLKISQIPYLDSGGIAYGPMVAALSVNNVPEAITTPRQLADFAGYVAGGGGGGGGGGDVHATFTIDGRAFARATAPYTREESNRASFNSSTLPKQ